MVLSVCTSITRGRIKEERACNIKIAEFKRGQIYLYALAITLTMEILYCSIHATTTLIDNSYSEYRRELDAPSLYVLLVFNIIMQTKLIELRLSAGRNVNGRNKYYRQYTQQCSPALGQILRHRI